MSATIGSKKMKFYLLGHGYDETRNDSGKGTKTRTISIPNRSYHGAFSQDGAYCWVSDDGFNGLQKYDTETWTTVSIGSVPSNLDFIIHPTNVSNDICFGYKSGTAYIFDLSTNDIINTGSISFPISGTTLADCVLDGNILRFCTLQQSVANNKVISLNIDTLAVSSVDVAIIMCGFTSKKNIYCHNLAGWNYKWLGVDNPSGGNVWGVTAVAYGSAGFPNLNSALCGFGANNRIYIPSKIDNVWVMAEFDATEVSDYETPTPIRSFGTFDSEPRISDPNSIYFIPFSNGRRYASFVTDIGLFVTDFRDVEKLTDTRHQPLAMTEDMILYRKVDGSGMNILYY